MIPTARLKKATLPYRRDVRGRFLVLGAVLAFALHITLPVQASAQVDATINGYQQPSDIYALPNFRGGLINWFPAAGTQVTATSDLFQNKLKPTAPVVTITTSGCGSQLLTNGDNLTVIQVEYDAYGNVSWSPPTQIAITVANACYQVMAPAIIFGGLGTGGGAGYITIAQQCSGQCGLPLSNPTLQQSTASSASPSSVFFTTPATQTYNYTDATFTASVSFSPGMMPPPDSDGLMVNRTVIQLGGFLLPGSGTPLFLIPPSAIPQYSQLKGLGRTLTTVGLNPQSPKGIPVFNLFGQLDTSTGSLSIGNAISVQACMQEKGGNQTEQVVSCSAVITSPPATTNNQQFKVNNPAPPFSTQSWSANMRLLIGERLVDNSTGGSASPSVWKVTSVSGAGTTGSSYPFGSTSSTLCASVGPVGPSTVTDNQVVYTCVLKGQRWSSNGGIGQLYSQADEVFDPLTGAYQEAASNCTGGTVAPPTFNAALGGLVNTDGSCTWYNIGPGNIVVGPELNWYSSAAFNPAATSQASTTLTTSTGNSSLIPWSGCSDTTTTSTFVTCQTNAVLHTTVFSAAGGGSSPPVPTFASVTTPTGLCAGGVIGCSGNIVTTDAYRAVVLWCTPTGCAPAMGEGSVTLGASESNHFIRVTPPANSNPPNAVGWTVGACNDKQTNHNPCTGTELVQALDGLNIICGSNTPSDYVHSLGHGALCAIGSTLTLVAPQAAQPPVPSRNVSEVMFALGGSFPYQTQIGNPFSVGAPSGYGSRLDDMAIEMGSSINVIEPYGTGVFNQLAQEGGGIGSQGEVEILDARPRLPLRAGQQRPEFWN